MKNLTLKLRKFFSAIWLFAIESLLGKVSFDEQMDCYWEGCQAAREGRAHRNPHLHPLRRNAFAAGVLMEDSAATAENPDFPAYGKDWSAEVNQGSIANNGAESQLASA